jgi:hypothetical protein
MFDSYRRYFTIRVFYRSTSSKLVTLNKLPFTGVAQRQRDGLITRRSHDRNMSPVFYNSCVLQKHIVKASDAKQAPCYRCGAEAARRADNPEVTGSKPVAGILSLRPFKEAGKHISPV